MKQRNRIVVLGILAFALPMTMLGQATTASIIGTVTDRFGAVVPNVTVTATQVDTNV